MRRGKIKRVIIVILVFMSFACSGKIEIKGNVINLQDINISGEYITYEIVTENFETVDSGRSRMKSNGDFRFSIQSNLENLFLVFDLLDFKPVVITGDNGKAIASNQAFYQLYVSNFLKFEIIKGSKNEILLAWFSDVQGLDLIEIELATSDNRYYREKFSISETNKSVNIIELFSNNIEFLPQERYWISLIGYFEIDGVMKQVTRSNIDAFYYGDFVSGD